MGRAYWFGMYMTSHHLTWNSYEGTWSNRSLAERQEDCSPCTPGSRCPAGAVRPQHCRAGSFAASGSLPHCRLCQRGSWQDDAGATACKPCGDSFVCAEGSIVRVPISCNAGTYLVVDGVAFTGASTDCRNCSPGNECYGGTARPRACSPGRSAASYGSAECSTCLAGRFQEAEGATECSSCLAGHYCDIGATVALPCPGACGMVVDIAPSCGDLTDPPLPLRRYLQ